MTPLPQRAAKRVAPDAGLRYPFTDPPKLGESISLAAGIRWIRMPLPIALNHINLWLLDDTNNKTLVVDTGLDTPEARQGWETLFAGDLAARPIGRVLLTHMHPDHLGLAGWLTRRFAVPLLMTREEYLMGRVLVADTGKDAPDEGMRFYRMAGCDTEQLDTYRRRFGSFGAMVSPLPEAFTRLRDGDTLETQSSAWQVIVGRGHSPEHACLYDAEARVLISGDQALPRISSIVGVWPQEPEANPLEDWLASCAHLRETIDEDVLVAPAHGLPFYGLPTRMRSLEALHARRLEAALDACSEKPCSAADTFPWLFSRPVGAEDATMAASEALAHLHCLVGRGAVRRDYDSAGVAWFTRA